MGLFIVSVVPVQPTVSIRHLDKLLHLCEYLLFAWLLVRAVRRSRMQPRTAHLRAWLYATGYGALIELIQAFLPWRSAELADALANAIGAGLGVWISKTSIVRSLRHTTWRTRQGVWRG